MCNYTKTRNQNVSMCNYYDQGIRFETKSHFVDDKVSCVLHPSGVRAEPYLYAMLVPKLYHFDTFECFLGKVLWKNKLLVHVIRTNAFWM